MREPVTMEGKPSLTTEGSPLLIRNTIEEIPYYRNKSLTIEGHNSRTSLTTEGNPLL